MKLKQPSITDTIAFLALILFVGACSYVQEDKTSITSEVKAIDQDPILNMAEVKPYFGGCEEDECSNEALIKYIYKNIEYPKEALAKGIEGKVYVQFVVEKDGSVSNISVVKDIGSGCGEAALAVISSMNNLKEAWSPGIDGGEKVRVRLTLPVSYRLENPKDS